MDRVRKIANDFFREQGITQLPISLDTVIDILKGRGWDVYLYSQAEDFIRSKHLENIRYTKNAFAIRDNSIQTIFYDDELGVLEKLDALCHELGHDVLGHTGHGVFGKSKKSTDVTHEKEADAFSLEFQAPAYKLYIDKIDSVKKIVRAGILSKENARIQYRKSYLKYAEEQKPQPAQKNTSKNKFARRWKQCIPQIALACLVVVFGISLAFPGHAPDQSTHNITISTPEVTQTVPPTPVPETAPPVDTITVKSLDYDRTMTVYRTKTGTKYHKESCRHLVGRSNTKTMTLETAIAAGLESCDDCFN